MAVTARAVFDHQLTQLQFKTLQLSEFVATQILQAAKALRKHDLTIAQCVDSFDEKVNTLRYEIEEQCYTLLALQQPNSRDMRRLVATVSVVTNLERMGDYAAGIARLVLRMGVYPSALYMVEFQEMAEIAAANLSDAMSAFAAEDEPLARAVGSRDDEIDALYKIIYDHLIQTMVNDPGTVEDATQLLWVAHNLERYADRISNICERTIYLVTGELHESHADKVR